MNINRPHRRLSLMLIIGALLLPITGFGNTAPLYYDKLDLTYSITYNGAGAGRLLVDIEQDTKNIQVVATTDLNLVARVFLDGFVSTTKYLIKNENVYLLRGSEEVVNDKDGFKEYKINYHNGTVRNSLGDRHPIEPDSWVIAQAFPLELMATSPLETKGKTVTQVGAKRVRYYKYIDPIEEIIKIGGKNVATYRVERQRKDDIKNRVRIWLSKDERIPLRISNISRGNETVLTLISKHILSKLPKAS